MRYRLRQRPIQWGAGPVFSQVCSYGEAFNEPSAEGHPEGNSRPNKIGHALHDRDPFFKRFARLPIYEGVAESIGLQNPRLIQSMLMFKTAQGGGEVHWHQDATFLRCEPFPIVGFGLRWNRRPSPTDACTWSRVAMRALLMGALG